jgi:hypothetical protein
VILIDVNVLVYAHRPDAPDHPRHKEWLDRVLKSRAAFGLSDPVLSAVVRVVTHPQIYRNPTPIEGAFEFVNRLRDNSAAVLVSPGVLHWSIFARLCRDSGAKGNLITDAFFAALAIEAGAEWITTDRDYARFPGLRWRHPLSPANPGRP